MVTVYRIVAQLFFDTQQLVVLCHTVGAAQRACLYLSAVGSHRNVGYRGIFRFSRTVGRNGGISVTMGHLDSVQRLCQRTDLVYFYQDGVGATLFDAHCQEIHVGDKQVVAHQLATIADAVGQFLPAFPVVFTHTVFDGVDGIFID